jgi:hypothetical protein
MSLYKKESNIPETIKEFACKSQKIQDAAKSFIVKHDKPDHYSTGHEGKGAPTKLNLMLQEPYTKVSRKTERRIFPINCRKNKNPKYQRKGLSHFSSNVIKSTSTCIM